MCACRRSKDLPANTMMSTVAQRSQVRKVHFEGPICTYSIMSTCVTTKNPLNLNGVRGRCRPKRYAGPQEGQMGIFAALAVFSQLRFRCVLFAATCADVDVFAGIRVFFVKVFFLTAYTFEQLRHSCRSRLPIIPFSPENLHESKRLLQPPLTVFRFAMASDISHST